MSRGQWESISFSSWTDRWRFEWSNGSRKWCFQDGTKQSSNSFAFTSSRLYSCWCPRVSRFSSGTCWVQSKRKAGRFLFWMCFAASSAWETFLWASPIKLQWDECWPGSLSQQILESVLLSQGHSRLRFFSIGKRRECSSAGRKELWSPFTALVHSARLKNFFSDPSAHKSVPAAIIIPAVCNIAGISSLLLLVRGCAPGNYR